MKPLKTLVLVKPEQPDAISKNGIIIPDSAKHRKNKGIIIAVGDGTKSEPMLLQVGMSVFNIKDCGESVSINGEEHFLIQQRDILAKEIA